MKQEGFFGLYKGAASPLAGAMAHNAVVFFSVGQSKKLLKGAKSQNSMGEIFIAGSIVGVAAVIVETPVDLLKCLFFFIILHSMSFESLEKR